MRKMKLSNSQVEIHYKFFCQECGNVIERKKLNFNDYNGRACEEEVFCRSCMTEYRVLIYPTKVLLNQE